MSGGRTRLDRQRRSGGDAAGHTSGNASGGQGGIAGGTLREDVAGGCHEEHQAHGEREGAGDGYHRARAARARSADGGYSYF